MKTIKLSNGGEALVDDEDFEMLSKFRWRNSKTPKNLYAESGASLRMHRLIMNCPDGLIVDHIDGDGLNNQKSNLRICSQRDNVCNSRKTPGKHASDYKGVTKPKWDTRWLATITRDGKSKNLGKFHSEEEAARAYDAAAIELHGEFARLNFPPTQE